MLEKMFKLKEHGTTVKTEVVAGLTTFLTMAYILFANPDIMSAAGMPADSVFVATALAAALGCFVMGFWANFPAGLAPGMGLNAFFAFAVVGGMGYTWEQALAAVFISGIVFFLLSVFRIREWIITSIPSSLRHGITVGIGLFLAIVALKSSGIIVAFGPTLVKLGDMTSAAPILAGLGFMLVIALDHRKVPGAVLISILAVSVVAAIMGMTHFSGLVSAPPSIGNIVLAMDFSRALEAGMISVVLAFVFVDLFDTTGTLMATASKAGLTDKNGRFDAMGRAMVADSAATTAGAALGVSSVTTYVESGSGIAAGGRTGLTAVVVGIMFLFAMFFSPLLSFVPAYATAPALLFIGLLMTADMTKVDWNDMTEAAPAWVAAIGMPLFFSISHGIGMGFVAYAIIKLLAGRISDIKPAVAIVAVLYIAGLATGTLG